MADWLQVARIEDLPPGTIVRVEGDDGPIAVANLNGEFYAVANICTHQAAELHEGELEADGELICPAHGAQFDIRTGEAMTPPAFENLATYSLRTDDGVVYVHSQAAE
ncbi:Rieske (2Fe-2S) protein [Thiohalorhabdus sp.]|uniref:Rieske (2Fe-2S) protein n=1 Tax=Thiohalorhabdus sp. TaxID=3094134 RepID=UPI002FC2A508